MAVGGQKLELPQGFNLVFPKARVFETKEGHKARLWSTQGKEWVLK